MFGFVGCLCGLTTTTTKHCVNRATDIKLNKWQEAINDCEECLRLDQTNVKAMLRKCDALIAINKKNDAYKIYGEILQIDPNNAVAKASLKNISIRYDDCLFVCAHRSHLWDIY